MRCARLDGMANPIPMLPDCPALLPAVAIATLMPITLPWSSTSAPPELPGLIPALVCRTESEIVEDEAVGALDPPGTSKFQMSNGFSPLGVGVVVSGEVGTAEDATVMLRLSALTIPLLTEDESPRGAPIMMAVSPTLSAEESANSAGTSPDASVSWMTARSEIASMPTTVAE